MHPLYLVRATFQEPNDKQNPTKAVWRTGTTIPSLLRRHLYALYQFQENLRDYTRAPILLEMVADWGVENERPRVSRPSGHRFRPMQGSTRGKNIMERSRRGACRVGDRVSLKA